MTNLIKQTKTGYKVSWIDNNNVQLVKFGTKYYGGFEIVPGMDMDEVISGAGNNACMIREIAKMGYGKTLRK